MTTIKQLEGRIRDIPNIPATDTPPVTEQPQRPSKTGPVVIETKPDIATPEDAQTDVTTIIATDKSKLLNAVGDLNEARVRALLEE